MALHQGLLIGWWTGAGVISHKLVHNRQFLDCTAVLGVMLWSVLRSVRVIFKFAPVSQPACKPIDTAHGPMSQCPCVLVFSSSVYVYKISWYVYEADRKLYSKVNTTMGCLQLSPSLLLLWGGA